MDLSALMPVNKQKKDSTKLKRIIIFFFLHQVFFPKNNRMFVPGVYPGSGKLGGLKSSMAYI